MDLFYIIMVPNHIELECKLIGITDTPEQFTEKWLERRPQWIDIEKDEKKITATAAMHGRLSQEEEDKYFKIKTDSTKPLYYNTFYWKPVKVTGEIFLTLDKDTRYSL